jgi:putative tryptophan/tyrosine transport system substrate-binding protein
MVSGGNPITSGFVQNLLRPGGNVTGLSSANAGLSGKRLELLNETFPSFRRVALLNPEHRLKYRTEEYYRVAAKLGVYIQSVALDTAQELEPAFERIVTMHADALITVRHILTNHHARLIAQFALTHRLPSMHGSEQFVTAGGLMSYGFDYSASWKRAAVFVDKILKGTNPASLPVEPTQLKFAINLKTAKRIGVTIPPEILLEANEVIR